MQREGLSHRGFAGGLPRNGDAFVQTLRQEFGEDIKVDYQVVGPVIAAHCGPGTLGLIFYGNK